MQSVSTFRRRQIGLVLAAFLALAGGICDVHDAFALAALVGAAGMIWPSRDWKSRLLAAAVVGGGLISSGVE